MEKSKDRKNRLSQTVFGWIFGILMMLAPVVMISNNVWAEPATEAAETTAETATETTPEGTPTEAAEVTNPSSTLITSVLDEDAVNQMCEEALGDTKWMVCPATGTVAQAVSWLYDKIDEVLELNPVEMKDGAPVYEIWKYFLGVTNVVFVIFLLVVIFSQLTGVGINNYGIKKVLPKLILVAVLANLSFIMSSLLVDLSNVIGNGLRGLFDSIELNALSSMQIGAEAVADGHSHDVAYYVSLAEGARATGGVVALAIGGAVIGFETGAIWMLIPVVLGGLVAVASGLITIALRQAVVVLLIMISPLALVAYMLPNTESWFKKWKDLFTKMLVFYPMFSLLFGASSLAGFAIVAGAQDGFGVLLGVAVQIFPLFFSWSLMKLSGTFLETVNAKIRDWGNRPVAGVRTWAESRKENTRLEHLRAENAYTPSLRLRQFLSNRKVAREDNISKNTEVVKQRGLAYDALKKRRADGTVSRDGERDYLRRTQLKRYEQTILKDENDASKGLAAVGYGALARNGVQYARLKKMDDEAIRMGDRMKVEQARTEEIDYLNARGFHRRMEEAVNAHMDEQYRGKTDDSGKVIYREHYKGAMDPAYRTALNRYNEMKGIMEGSEYSTQYAAAAAAYNYDTQAKIVMGKFQKYFELTPPTRDLRYRLQEFSKLLGSDPNIKAVDNIDAIVSGLRILNERGDTDFIREILKDLLNEDYGGLELGTHASQSLATFFMQDVKGADPWLRRFGKYLNTETAAVFDKSKRGKRTVDYEEYVKGYYFNPGDEHTEENKKYPKYDIIKLMEGTSLDDIERTAMDNYVDAFAEVYKEDVLDENGNPVLGPDGKPKQKLNLKEFLKRRSEMETATLPQFISANLKFLSGSEQITSSVKAKAGYMWVQDEKTGKRTMVPVWENEKYLNELLGDMDPEEKAEAAKELKKWYRNNFEQYIRGQTPAQILGFRSDYEKAVTEHEFESYFWDDKNENELPERRALYREMEQEIEKDNFGLTDPAAINAAREQAKTKLKRALAGETFRTILYDKGKIGQIEKSKHSGAANNAKDWLREMLLLDSEYELDAWITRHQKGIPMEGDGGDVAGGTDGAPSGPVGGGPVSGGSAGSSSADGGMAGGNPAEVDGVEQQATGPAGGGGVTVVRASGSGAPAAPAQGGSRSSTTTVTTPAKSSRGKGKGKGKKEEDNRKYRKETDRDVMERLLKTVKNQQTPEADANMNAQNHRHSVYTAEDIARFKSEVDKIYYDLHGTENEIEDFYEASYDYATQTFSADSYVVVNYERFYENGDYSSSYDLRQELKRLIETLMD